MNLGGKGRGVQQSSRRVCDFLDESSPKESIEKNIHAVRIGMSDVGCRYAKRTVSEKMGEGKLRRETTNRSPLV